MADSKTLLLFYHVIKEEHLIMVAIVMIMKSTSDAVHIHMGKVYLHCICLLTSLGGGCYHLSFLPETGKTAFGHFLLIVLSLRKE